MLLLPTKSQFGGVQMKRAEAITISLAGTDLFPQYHNLPDPSSLCEMASAEGGMGLSGERVSAFFAPDGWSTVPPQVDPATALPQKRRRRKREQVENMVRCCAALILTLEQAGNDGLSRTFVDFCGGAGHVGVVIAWLFPAWHIVCIDLKERSLALGRTRAEAAGCGGNYEALCADVRSFDRDFSVGAALHACGAASDFSLESCTWRGALIAVCPCCVGKIAGDRPENGGGAGRGARSNIFRSKLHVLVEEARDCMGGDECWDPFEELASAGDFGDHVEGDVGWWRRAAKSLLESDRMHHLSEGGGGGEGGVYTTRLCKMEPLEASPKNDIIVAWKACSKGEGVRLAKLFGKVDARGFNKPGAYSERCEAEGEDVERAAYIGDFENDGDAEELKARLKKFAESERETETIIDGVSGARRRKMVHAIAESFSLAHKSEGKGAARVVRVWKLPPRVSESCLTETSSS